VKPDRAGDGGGGDLRVELLVRLHGGRRPHLGLGSAGRCSDALTSRSPQCGLAAAGWYVVAVERSAVALAGSWLTEATAPGGEAMSTTRPMLVGAIDRHPGRAGGRATVDVGWGRVVSVARSRS
jgi:hypothetical protein